jgi:drug/metabolite transporter (DMT)-like permease
MVSGLVQAVYFSLLSRAYTTGDLSVVYPIARGIGVAGAAVAGVGFLSESISTTGGLGILSICCGTAAVGLAGALGDKKSVYYSLAIGVTLTTGSIVDKLAVSTIHPVFYIFCMFAISTLIGLPKALKRADILMTWRQHKRTILTIGPGSLGGYLIILFAFQYGPMAYLIAMRESSVLFGSVFGIWFLRERFTWRKGLGIAAIFAGLVLIRLA